MECTYLIAETGDLICMRVTGVLTLANISTLELAFGSAMRARHQRLLMDFRGVTKVAVSVSDFTTLGSAGRASAAPAGGRRAAYVADNDLVFGYTRVIAAIWDAHLPVECCRDLNSACAWLGLPESTLAGLVKLSSG